LKTKWIPEIRGIDYQYTIIPAAFKTGQFSIETEHMKSLLLIYVPWQAIFWGY